MHRPALPVAVPLELNFIKACVFAQDLLHISIVSPCNGNRVYDWLAQGNGDLRGGFYGQRNDDGT